MEPVGVERGDAPYRSGACLSRTAETWRGIPDGLFLLTGGVGTIRRSKCLQFRIVMSYLCRLNAKRPVEAGLSEARCCAEWCEVEDFDVPALPAPLDPDWP